MSSDVYLKMTPISDIVFVNTQPIHAISSLFFPSLGKWSNSCD